MGWVESIGIFFAILVVVISFVIRGLHRGESEIEEYPFRPLPPHLTDKLKVKDVPLAQPGQ